MAHRLCRTQILLEPEQQAWLKQTAQREGRTVSEVIREIVQEVRMMRTEETSPSGDPLEEIRRSRQEILARRGGEPLELDAAALIQGVRDERDEEILAAVHASRH